MKIAIVGGGIFGITVAIKLAKHGYTVDLFEKSNDILTAASSINQYRLHRGYHYPRSPETIVSSRDSEQFFIKEYREAILQNIEHYYCIAKEGSLTSAKKFLNICKTYNLDFNISKPGFIALDRVELAIKVREFSIDPKKLKEICWQRLQHLNVNVILNTEATNKTLESYDVKILCTYAYLNKLLGNESGTKKKYQFELCEKPIIKLPRSFGKKSIVIMDGPFMSLDPYGVTGLFVMGHVVHAIHQTNIGEKPIVDKKFKELLNKGVIKNPPITNFNLFIESGKEFVPQLAYAKHVGSMFTIKAVLPYIDDTDSRPTIVEELGNKIITVFSGKIGNSVQAAESIVEIVKQKND